MPSLSIVLIFHPDPDDLSSLTITVSFRPKQRIPVKENDEDRQYEDPRNGLCQRDRRTVIDWNDKEYDRVLGKLERIQNRIDEVLYEIDVLVDSMNDQEKEELYENLEKKGL